MRSGPKKFPYLNKSLKDLPGEKWKEMPGWEDYEVSSYGRVKSTGRWITSNTGKEVFKKERILSQYARASPSPFNKDTLHYLTVGVQKDNHRKVLRTARLVYYLFVKKFPLEDIKRIIQYKDGNGLNIHPSNLLLSSNSEKMKRTVEKNRTPRIRKVTQFNLDGKRIKLHSSIHQAAESVKGQSSRVYTVLDKWPHYYKGFLWRSGDRQKTKLLAAPLINYPKKVIQHSLQGKKIAVFASLNQAAKKVGATSSNLRKALNGKCKTCRGYRWKWADVSQ